MCSLWKLNKPHFSFHTRPVSLPVSSFPQTQVKFSKQKSSHTRVSQRTHTENAGCLSYMPIVSLLTTLLRTEWPLSQEDLPVKPVVCLGFSCLPLPCWLLPCAAELLLTCFLCRLCPCWITGPLRVLQRWNRTLRVRVLYVFLWWSRLCYFPRWPHKARVCTWGYKGTPLGCTAFNDFWEGLVGSVPSTGGHFKKTVYSDMYTLSFPWTGTPDLS